LTPSIANKFFKDTPTVLLWSSIGLSLALRWQNQEARNHHEYGDNVKKQAKKAERRIEIAIDQHIESVNNKITMITNKEATTVN
jgi:hypothetical protein